MTTLGTTVLTVATGVLAGSSTNAENRLLSTVVGAAVVTTAASRRRRNPKPGMSRSVD
jgi:ABC-type lipoprotein release transport system permease subunit